MVPLRKHFVPSKHLTDVVKHNNTLEEVSRGLGFCFAHRSIQSRAEMGPESWSAGGRQLLKSHYMSS